MAQATRIKSIGHLTHDVLQIVLEKPAGLTLYPGQAVDVAINKPGWEEGWRSFTPVSLEDDAELELNIKVYADRKGVTNELQTLKNGDELLIGDAYGDIQYKGEGIFIAGGAGITPFLAILKHLNKNKKLANNKLIFANKTKGDIIKEAYFNTLLGKNFINVLSDESIDGYAHGFVTPDIIKNQIEEGHQYFYLCAPPPMMTAVEKGLASLGVKEENIVKEGF
ncbi:MAG: FAD-binding oxidoreductase [Chitinophagales bacterium]|nr:FAD-binding oxidoreductase [Chitinophagales bacterium]MCO5249755.1 FAD-binding oxidoreductase [Chitinophagales bacterium]